MSEITIENVEANGTTVRAAVRCTPDVRRFFTGDDFFVEYDVDVADVDESILSIPVLAQVCPVAWANGADVSVSAVDRDFLAALNEVQGSLRSMYPEFIDGGRIYVDETVDNRGTPRENSALLFSGGIDSLTSLIRHREERPTLVGVHGWVIDVEQEDEWAKTREKIGDVGDRFGVDTEFVQSNMLSFLDTPMLHAHFKRFLVGSWYSGVGHGLGLLGLCAPLTVPKRIGQLYIASTHTEEFSHPWGSHPDIDDRVRWGNTAARHDGFELGRQEKIERVAGFVRDSQMDVPVFTCNRGVGENCNRCEKCCRTAIGMVLAGMNPNRHGYRVTDETFDHARDRLDSGAWLVDEDVLFMWRDIQRHVQQDPDVDGDAARRFFRWLRAVDLEDRFERTGTPVRHQIVRTVARHTPNRLYSTLYPVYSSLKKNVET